MSSAAQHWLQSQVSAPGCHAPAPTCLTWSWWAWLDITFPLYFLQLSIDSIVFRIGGIWVWLHTTTILDHFGMVTNLVGPLVPNWLYQMLETVDNQLAFKDSEPVVPITYVDISQKSLAAWTAQRAFRRPWRSGGLCSREGLSSWSEESWCC